MLFNLYRNMDLLTNGCRTLTRRCVTGMSTNVDVCRQYVERSIGLATALAPVLGYERSAEIAHQALASNRSISEVALEKRYLTQEQLDQLLDPARMTRPFNEES